MDMFCVFYGIRLINPLVSRYIPNPDFEPSIIRNVSMACEGLCRWVRAMEVYDR